MLPYRSLRLSAAGLVSESDESNLPYGDSPWLEVCAICRGELQLSRIFIALCILYILKSGKILQCETFFETFIFNK